MSHWSFIICCLTLFGIAASRTLIPVEVKSDAHLAPFSLSPAVAAYGDIVVSSAKTPDRIVVMQRDSDGFYKEKASVNVPDTPSEISTDGSWFAVSIPGSLQSLVFQIDESTGAQINLQSFYSERDTARLIAPNTLVVVNDSYLITYEYNGAKWMLINESPFGIQGYINYEQGYEPYRMTKDFFVAMYYYDNTASLGLFAFIMQRQTNKTWTLYDTFNVTIGGPNYPQHATYNGNGTLVVSFSSNSVVYVYQRERQGVWTRSTVLPSDLGYFPVYVGSSVLSLDSNNYLISAPVQASGFDGTGGAVVLMHRDDADSAWEFPAEFGQFSNRNIGWFGLGLVKNDHDVLIYACLELGEESGQYNCSFLTYPACFVSPIDITCPATAELEQCDSFSVSSLFTVNSPSNCGVITAAALQTGWSSTGLEVSVTLRRDFVAPVTCSVSVTCPLPPVTVPPVEPPTTLVCPPSPTALVAPVKVSSAGSLVINVVLLVLVCLGF